MSLYLGIEKALKNLNQVDISGSSGLISVRIKKADKLVSLTCAPSLVDALKHASTNFLENKNLSNFQATRTQRKGIEKWFEEGHNLEILIDSSEKYFIFEAKRKWDNAVLFVSFEQSFEKAYDLIEKEFSSVSVFSQLIKSANEPSFNGKGDTIIPCPFYSY